MYFCPQLVLENRLLLETRLQLKYFFNLSYQGNKLFLCIVCTIAVTVDPTLRNTFTGIFLFRQNSGYDIFNSIMRWLPASMGYPACIRDPSYIRSFMVCYSHVIVVVIVVICSSVYTILHEAAVSLLN